MSYSKLAPNLHIKTERRNNGGLELNIYESDEIIFSVRIQEKDLANFLAGNFAKCCATYKSDEWI